MLNKVARFCLTNLLEKTQQAHLGVMLGALTAVKPHLVVDKIIPSLLRILLDTPQDQALPRLRTPRVTTPTRPSSSSKTSPPKHSPPAEPGSAWGGGEEGGGEEGQKFELAHLSEKEIR